MVKRSFLGLAKPTFQPQRVSLPFPALREVPVPGNVTLFLKKPKGPGYEKDTVALTQGDLLKTGQKIALSSDSSVYLVSSVTGTVSKVSPFVGDFGTVYIAVSVDVAAEEVFDETFTTLAQNADPALAKGFLGSLPGNPPFGAFFNDGKKIQTLCITGIEPDLASLTRRWILMNRKEDIRKGIEGLKRMVRTERIVFALPQDADSGFEDAGVEVRKISAAYPGTLPQMLMRDLFGQTVPAGKTCEDLGIAFFSIEAVAALGAALSAGKFPATKIVTVIDQDRPAVLVSARIGTPVKEILASLGIVTKEMDRIVFGGPMTGSSVFSEDQPILADTDTILVQDRTRIPPISQHPCINCGECVRICPAKIPVNMLIRYLETGRYEDAADLYDLHCCIECGLCSFVCVARIPIFQYIRLGKHELQRMHAAEANHA